MRITIEPTHQGLGGEYPNPKTSLEIPTDDYTIDEVLENLVTPALRAFGYLIEDGQIYFDDNRKDQSAVGVEFLREGYDQLAKEAEALIEVPHYDKWEETFDGKCDICRATKTINEVTPGVQFGWRVGYVCASCSSRKTPNI